MLALVCLLFGSNWFKEIVMLSNSVAIISPTSLGGGSYSFLLYFQTGSQAKFLRVGDTIKDATGNEYSITTWAIYPSDFVSAGSVTVSFITTDVLPNTDSGYNSEVFTPGQVDYRPYFNVAGTIGNISTYSGQNYEYQLQSSWLVPSERDKAVVGDSIVDGDGKEFVITFIDGGGFAVGCRVTEKEKIGIAPLPGSATMYKATSASKFFQGTELTDPARTNIQNRDFVLVDLALAAGGGGGAASIEKTMENGAGSTIPAYTPVSKKIDGTIVHADSDATDGQRFIGITGEEILSGATGTVKLVGQNLAGAISGLGYSVGDDVYLSESGGYTNDPNSFTGDNDSIIRVGIADCSEGSASSTATDLIMFSEVLIRP
jgi:hypothetical protein